MRRSPGAGRGGANSSLVVFQLEDFSCQLILRLDRVTALCRGEMAILGCTRARHVRFHVHGLSPDLTDLTSGQRTRLYALLDMVLLFLSSSVYVVVMVRLCNRTR